MNTKILFLSGREVNYIRNRVLSNALKINFDVTVSNNSEKNIVFRSLNGIYEAILNNPHYDIIFAGFYGQLIALALSKFQTKPIILDAYVSTYETLCEDRKLFRGKSFLGRLFFLLDKISISNSRIVLTDTIANMEYLAKVFNISRDKFRVIYVGCDEDLFFPRTSNDNYSSRCEVFYYGSFLPLQGIDIIIQAANLLKSHNDIHFTIGGYGLDFNSILDIAKKFKLDNIDFVGWIPFDKLPIYIAKSDICLGGHFSTIPKARRVISTKTYQFIAMRKPTIVGDNIATRELFINKEHVYAVEMGNPYALANAIEELSKDQKLKDYIAENGYLFFKERLTIKSIAADIFMLIKSI